MKLSPLKRAFGIRSGKFLGFMVNQCGVEANPKNMNAQLEMSSLMKLKEVMSLAGKVATLSHFMSRTTDHCTPFFDTLKGSKKFEWTDKCTQAFLAFKEHLGHPPLLSKPTERKKLYIYLIVSEETVSATLVREEEKV